MTNLKSNSIIVKSLAIILSNVRLPIIKLRRRLIMWKKRPRRME